MRARNLLSLLALALVLGGCAWSNRDNRPVWNAFEEHLVPEGDAAFYGTLPLTVPGGIVAILVDTFIAHPIQVADDAWDDAGDVWDDMDWREEYYTEMVRLPLRGIFTPIAFVGSFLGRSLFDIEPHRSEGEIAKIADRRARELIGWFNELAAGSSDANYKISPDDWSDALQQAFDRARAQAGPKGRYELYRYAQRRKLEPWTADPEMGLRDRDPVVRYLVLDNWSGRDPVSDATRRALLADPNEAVRELAAETWPE
ncbi:MAG: hypothetical protein ACYTCU_03240 [Planctomycetota bacterium]|jgi:hypothetical protein